MENSKLAGVPNRIVGATPIEEEYDKKDLATLTILENSRTIDDEIPKSPEEIEIIMSILRRTPEFLKEYGVNTETHVTLNQIHILDSKKHKLGKEVLGSYKTSGGIIKITQEKNTFRLAHALVHELLHANSFYSLTFKKQDGLYIFRRFGITIKKRADSEQEQFLNSINEAVTEILTTRFTNKYFTEIYNLKEPYEEHKKKTLKDRKINDDLDPDSLVNEESYLEGMGYYLVERYFLLKLIEQLQEKNNTEFSSKEEIFRLFTKAMFTGELLPLARLIEKTLGKGTFREIAELNHSDMLKKISKQD